MPSFELTLESEPSNSYRVEKVRGSYDLQDKLIEEHFAGEIKTPNDWQIGVITGHSGTGKTQIAQHIWPDHFWRDSEWSADSVVDDFDADSHDAVFKMLHRVGFGSIPSWLKPYRVLSQGEQMRCEIARALLSDQNLVVFDEFTSTVDRDVARFGCMAVKKAIRNSDKQFIAVSCHDDFISWLEPDWVFDTNTMEMRSKKNENQSEWKCASVKGAFGECLGAITI